MTTILVTGGAGFIGSHTVDKFLQEGYKVKILDNFSTGKLANLPSNHPDLTIIKGDICNIDDCVKAVHKCNYIIHLAAQVSVVKTIENPQQSFSVNLIGFFNILEIARQNKNISKIIFSSSAAIYGDNKNLPLDEDVIPAAALSPYALEKITAEKYLQLYAKLYDVKYSILRYFNVYGIRQDPSSPYSGVISKFIHFYNNKMNFEIYGDGRQTRDFINVFDVANANFLAVKKGDNAIYNIASGKASSLLDLVEIFKQKSATNNYNISTTHHPARSGDIKHSAASIAKAKKELGFNCQYDLSAVSELF